MKLDYYDLISPVPFTIQNVGSLKPYTLRDIAKLTYRVYSTYIALLNISPKDYCTKANPDLTAWYEGLPEDQRSQLDMYDIAVSSSDMQRSFSAILDFFFLETVIYHPTKDAFLLLGDESVVTGMINKSNYTEICSIILQFNHIQARDDVNLSKVKNQKGLKRYLEMQKQKENHRVKPRSDSNLDLGNIISSVCAMHNSINYTNVWDMTIYQLWDTFVRLRNLDVYVTSRTAVSVWGDKDNKFDFNSWFKNTL